MPLTLPCRSPLHRHKPDLTQNYEGKSPDEAKEQYVKDIHTGATKFDYQVGWFCSSPEKWGSRLLTLELTGTHYKKVRAGSE